MTALGVKKLGERNKLLAKIAKLKANDRVTLTESETSSQSDGGGAGCVFNFSFFFEKFRLIILAIDSDDVKITAMLKKKTVELTVSQTISLSALLDKLANSFGQRVKVREKPLFIYLFICCRCLFCVDSRCR